MKTPDTIYFNGIDGDSGEYWIAPRSIDDLRVLAPHLRVPPRQRKLSRHQDPTRLADVGWGVVLPVGIDDDRSAALRPLIEQRSRQLGRPAARFEVHPKESWPDFRERYGLGPGTLGSTQRPYHLLIVARPDEISFDFQSGMAGAHSVGRLDFRSVADLEAHIDALLKYERKAVPDSIRRAALLGIAHLDDPLTQSAVENLVKELDSVVPRDHPDWQIETHLRRAPDKAQILRLLSAEQRPSVLFTAGHGIGFKADRPRHESQQGALLCADFPGTTHWGSKRPLSDDVLLSASDIAPHWNLQGWVGCLFACYSAGTSEHGLYSLTSEDRKAHRSHVSLLPQKLLARGALGVIGHVGIALEQSYLWYSAGPQISTFRGLLQDIMAGDPIGHAMDHLQSRQMELANDWGIQSKKAMRSDDPKALFARLRAWSTFEDARHYILLGDPAARLHLAAA